MWWTPSKQSRREWLKVSKDKVLQHIWTKHSTLLYTHIWQTILVTLFLITVQRTNWIYRLQSSAVYIVDCFKLRSSVSFSTCPLSHLLLIITDACETSLRRSNFNHHHHQLQLLCRLNHFSHAVTLLIHFVILIRIQWIRLIYLLLLLYHNDIYQFHWSGASFRSVLVLQANIVYGECASVQCKQQNCMNLCS